MVTDWMWLDTEQQIEADQQQLQTPETSPGGIVEVSICPRLTPSGLNTKDEE